MATSSQPIPYRGRLASFVRKHNRLLTSIGAVVVVLTFVAREGIQESLKNSEDSIEFARNAYSMRADTQALSDKVGGVYIVLSDLTEELTSHPPGFKKGDRDGVVVSQFNFYKDQLDGIQRVLETARALLGALPQSSAELVEADAIAKQIVDIRQKMDREENELQIDAVPPPGKSEHTRLSPEVIKKLNESTLNLTLGNAGVWSRVEGLATKALSVATAEDDKYRRWYRWSAVGSWVLYTLGVALSLLTAIYSKSGDTAEALTQGE
jgi:hypothetical protein